MEEILGCTLQKIHIYFNPKIHHGSEFHNLNLHYYNLVFSRFLTFLHFSIGPLGFQYIVVA